MSSGGFACRSCSAAEAEPVLSLGSLPLVNAFIDPAEAGREARYTLDVVRCPACSLVQLTVIVPPEILFRIDTTKKPDVLSLFREVRLLLSRYPTSACILTFNMRKRKLDDYFLNLVRTDDVDVVDRPRDPAPPPAASTAITA